MSILARYKKRGGFRQLLELIESGSPEKQEKLLKVIRAEDPYMAEEVEKKILTFEKVCNWKVDNLCIVMEEITLQYRSILCKAMDKETWEKIKPVFKIQTLRELEDHMENSKDPLPGEILAAQAALYASIRELDEERVIVLSMIDPSLKIDEAA